MPKKKKVKKTKKVKKVKKVKTKDSIKLTTKPSEKKIISLDKMKNQRLKKLKSNLRKNVFII